MYKIFIIFQELANYEEMPDGPAIDYKSKIYDFIYYNINYNGI